MLSLSSVSMPPGPVCRVATPASKQLQTTTLNANGAIFHQLINYQSQANICIIVQSYSCFDLLCTFMNYVLLPGNLGWYDLL